MGMTEASEYLAIGEHDLEVARVLSEASGRDNLDATDWLVTIHFYALRMYLKALESLVGLAWQRHEEVHRWLNTTPDLLPISRPYWNFDRLSRSARYEGKQFGARERERLARDFRDARGEIFSRLTSRGLKTPDLRGPYL